MQVGGSAPPDGAQRRRTARAGGVGLLPSAATSGRGSAQPAENQRGARERAPTPAMLSWRKTKISCGRKLADVGWRFNAEYRAARHAVP
jgi:hypothetical protein